ncbi:MAG: hypothetical protein Q7W56_03615 [Candidatus Latescibacteria bacterium]|nr:hypothetical protein [Candidatus Latescibacterota bacterium]
MPTLHTTTRTYLTLTAVLAWGLTLGGCKSSTPTKPDPVPSQGQVTLVRNDSYFAAMAAAGYDCNDTQTIDPADDDFSPTTIDFGVTCSAEAQGETHSGNMDVEGSLTYRFEAPDDGLSEIRLVAWARGGRSATGLSSSGSTVRARLQMTVTGDPVAYRAVGTLNFADHFTDMMKLRDVAAAPGVHLFAHYGDNDGVAGETDLDTSGTLPAGSYELWVELSTHDWFTEEVDFTLSFTAPEAN